MNYGRYQIIKEVGRGSMGVVYEARDPHIDRVVAVKVLRQDRMSTEAFVKRFFKEAKVIGRLSHPNIVAIYDAGEEEGNVYIAMEFLTGTSLAEIIQGKPLNADEVVAFGIQIAEALDYAHQKGVVHRDIKPSNIVVQADGLIKITDFGIAHIDDSSATDQTQAGEILGTPSYMSPEQVLGKPVDGRSDLFSLGVILYELCTGRRAFGGREKNLATIFNEIINVTPEEPSVVESLIPNKLSAIIMRTMQKEPIGRFQTGNELAEALKNCSSDSQPVEVVLPLADKKKKFLSPVIMATGVVIVACAAMYILQSKNPSPHSEPQKAVNGQPVSKPPALSPQSGKGYPDQKSQDKKPSEQSLPLPTPSDKPPLKHTSETGAPQQQPPTSKTQPAAELVILKVKTTPQGANIYVDGERKGITPITLHVAKGTHLLRMSRAGFRDMEKQITIEETMEYPLNFNLKSSAGSD